MEALGDWFSDYFLHNPIMYVGGVEDAELTVLAIPCGIPTVRMPLHDYQNRFPLLEVGQDSRAVHLPGTFRGPPPVVWF